MALLNKLLFPSATSVPTTASATTSSDLSTLPSLRFPHKSANPSSGTGASSSANSKRQNNNQFLHSKNYLSQFPFDGRQVRVLLYRECDSRRRLLFDSNALEKVPLKEATKSNLSKSLKAANATEKYVSNQHGHHDYHGKQSGGRAHSSGFIEVCKEYGYKHNRPDLADLTSIGEMVFGASAMSFRGTALKVHWLQGPSRILCSEVFLAPVNQPNSHSPYSTLSMNSLATPRTSISSDHGSFDGISMNSLSMPYSVSVSRHMSLTPSDRNSISYPLDVPDQQSLSANSDSIRTDSGPRYSSTYSTATDSGYSGMSRSQLSSDQWSNSSQYLTRSSLGSVMSEQSDSYRKFSMDSCSMPLSHLFHDGASDGSLQRRISRNLRTSFENENSMNDFIGFLSDNYPIVNATNGGSEGGNIGVPNYRRASYCANESRSNPEIGKRRDVASVKSSTRRSKLGLAVCITMSESFEEEMELFCSEHIALLESMLSRLRASTERAYINHKELLQIMVQAWQETQQWFSDLFTAPRIKCPVWLSITTSGSKYSKNVADGFIKELCWLLSFADTKDTNFFISTMLTAILTHHLGWVSTVSAFNYTSSRSERSSAAIEQRAKLLQVSQKHPYNALWAQMGDLYGAIGMPPKLTRTIIYGTEKLWVERTLNILTYFIRCGEIRRSAKREDFNKDLINSIVAQNKNETLKKSYANRIGERSKRMASGGGLTRTATCKQNLNTITDNNELSSSSGSEETDEMEIVKNLKKNEIPNVLAFRDSRFVQQELRIGNYLMDTGIEKNSLSKFHKNSKKSHGASSKDGHIRLTVTTPDNVELNVDDENASSNTSVGDGVLEAIEIDSIDSPELELPSKVKTGKKNNFFWAPQTVTEGLSMVDLEKLQNGAKLINQKLDHRAFSFSAQHQPVHDKLERRVSHLSLSDLITQNSMGKSDRMTWGIEPIKENVSLEEQIHFDYCQKIIEREHGICRTNDNSANGVVFVLGENEPLVNIKKSNEDLTDDQQATQSKQNVCQTLCPLHQCTHGSVHSKKHSGVIFNFEQFPQIATNYMRSKNLDISNHNLLMNKCAKLDATEPGDTQPIGATSFPNYNKNETVFANSSDCYICQSILNSCQTPSNATELEFETDELHCHPSTATICERSIDSPLHSVNSAASVDTLKSVPTINDMNSSAPSQPDVNSIASTSTSGVKRNTFYSSNRKVSSHRGSISSVAAKCAAVNDSIHLLNLPVPGIKELSQEDEPPGDMKLRAGFIPSLFLNVNDHYISDMVLQGTCSSPNKWESTLREDLALAAHSASLISLPVENIAIVADMDKWDVRLISSQTHSFPYGGNQSAPVGMSQLVASMLDTVQAMNGSGISAYECLSFLESKLQEIYLQSETLAAFLLATEFCPLSDVTTTLNLSENDVPLLLSIASIHTPQISKKCGISFR